MSLLDKSISRVEPISDSAELRATRLEVACQDVFGISAPTIGPRGCTVEIRYTALTFDNLSRFSELIGTKDINVVSSTEHGYYPGEVEHFVSLEVRWPKIDGAGATQLEPKPEPKPEREPPPKLVKWNVELVKFQRETTLKCTLIYLVGADGDLLEASEHLIQQFGVQRVAILRRSATDATLRVHNDATEIENVLRAFVYHVLAVKIGRRV